MIVILLQKQPVFIWAYPEKPPVTAAAWDFCAILFAVMCYT